MQLITAGGITTLIPMIDALERWGNPLHSSINQSTAFRELQSARYNPSVQSVYDFCQHKMDLSLKLPNFIQENTRHNVVLHAIIECLPAHFATIVSEIRMRPVEYNTLEGVRDRLRDYEEAAKATSGTEKATTKEVKDVLVVDSSGKNGADDTDWDSWEWGAEDEEEAYWGEEEGDESYYANNGPYKRGGKGKGKGKKGKKGKGKGKKGKKPNKGAGFQGFCFTCGSWGHSSQYCRNAGGGGNKPQGGGGANNNKQGGGAKQKQKWVPKKKKGGK